MPDGSRDPGATRVSLTNTAIEAMSKGDELKDDRVPGLSVRRHASGWSFMLYYRTKTGIPRRPKLGDYGTLSLSQAREIAKSLLASVAGGGDPVAERAVARHEPVLNDLWDRCEREHYNRGKAWDQEAKRLYVNHAKGKLGKIRLRSLTYSDVNSLHQEMRAEPFQANHMIAVLSKMLNLAERWGLRDMGTNPCQHVQRFAEPKRRRFATGAEIAKLGPIMDRKAAGNPSGVAFLYLLLFSGARPSEIEKATPKMLERVGDGAVVRLPDGKNGARDVFLPPQAVAVLDRLPAKRDRLAGRATLPRKLWESIRKEAGCGDLWARDLRRTFATVAMSGGTPVGVVGELLGHKSAQTTKIYAKLMEDPAHSAAAKTAGAIEQMLKG